MHINISLPFDSFVALDIELANTSPTSICEIAFVKFVKGKNVGEYVSLVRPDPYDLIINLGDDEDDDEEDLSGVYVDPFSENIHGITANDLKNAPTLEDIWAEIGDFLGDLPLVAHNATQDIKKLLAALEDQDLSLPDKNYFCTLTLSRNLSKPNESNVLEDLANRLDVNWSTIERPSGVLGHSALNDARATGEIMVKFLESAQGSFDWLNSELGMTAGEIVGSKVKKGHTKKQIKTNPLWQTLTPEQFEEFVASLPDLGFETRSNHVFSDKNFVITLWLDSMSEIEFWFCVALCGGNMKTSVSKFTHYLVEGQDPKGKYVKGQTTKSIKAKEVISQGKSDLVILDESEFLKLLGDEVLKDLKRFRDSSSESSQ